MEKKGDITCISMKAHPLMFTLTIPRYKVHAQKLCIASLVYTQEQKRTRSNEDNNVGLLTGREPW